MEEVGGIEKIFGLFNRATNKLIKDRSAICIGRLYRAREIEN
jgi:hypothetical protein